jgi:hypothetical protein
MKGAFPLDTVLEWERKGEAGDKGGELSFFMFHAASLFLFLSSLLLLLLSLSLTLLGLSLMETIYRVS